MLNIIRNKNNTDNNQVKIENKASEKNITIECAMSSTSYDRLLMDGAAVLKHCMCLSSIRNPDSASKYYSKIDDIVHD